MGLKDFITHFPCTSSYSVEPPELAKTKKRRSNVIICFPVSRGFVATYFMSSDFGFCFVLFFTFDGDGKAGIWG